MNSRTHPRLLLATLAGFCLPFILPAAEAKKTEPDAPAAATPYVLFMGADLAVQREKEYHKVRDVSGSELKIQIGKRDFFVPTRRNQTGIKIDNSLKLTNRVVQLAGLEAGPGYTPANDPKLQFDRESGAAGGAAAVQDLAYGRMISASLNAGMASAVAANNEGGFGAAASRAAADAAQLQLSEAERSADLSSQMAMQDRYSTGHLADRMQNKLAEGNYDTLEVSFKISSPVELESPYMVVLFKYLEPGAKPGETGLMIHAKALEPIGPKPKYIRVRETGVPVGFKYLSCEVHIYNRGQEVATSASSNRVELTRDEAREYLLLDHLSSNPEATKRATAVPGSLPVEFRSQLASEQMLRACYVRVSADGNLLGAFADESTNLPLTDPTVTAALAESLYLPALQGGQPKEGIVRVTLAELAR